MKFVVINSINIFQLASIPGLDVDLVVDPAPIVISTPQPPDTVNNTQNLVNHYQVDDSQPPEDSIGTTATTPEVVADDNTEPDPSYTKFFKMVQFGVPPQAVKLKMQSEGLNPDFLE
jgi:Subunit CCDC53 of WASH complex